MAKMRLFQLVNPLTGENAADYGWPSWAVKGKMLQEGKDVIIGPANFSFSFTEKPIGVAPGGDWYLSRLEEVFQCPLRETEEERGA